MSEKGKDMTKGSPFRLLLLFSLPLMLGNIFQQLYVMIDAAVVGQGVGLDALASIGAAEWLNYLVIGTVIGFTQGFSVRLAQHFGAKDTSALRSTFSCCVFLSAITAFVLLLVSQLSLGFLLRILNTPEHIFPGAVLYLRILFAGIPFTVLYNLSAAALRAFGDSKTPLYAMVTASVVNILLDCLFVFVFSWGIAGAAIATVLAQAAAGGICLFKILKLSFLRPFVKQWDGRLSLSLWKLGLPMAFQNVIISVGGMMVQMVVNGFGMLFIAGFTATNKLYGLLEVAATSFGYAVVTYVGQNYGAKSVLRIEKGVKSGILFSFAASALIAALMLFFGETFLSLFISRENPNEASATLDIAFRYLKVMSLCLPTLYLLYTYRSALQGLGNALIPMLSGVGEFLMRIGVALLLPLFIGENGIFYAEVAAWIGANFILIPAYYRSIRKLKRNFSPDL